MVQVVYKRDDKKFNYGNTSKRAEAEKLFMNAKKKVEPYFIKKVAPVEVVASKDINDDIKHINKGKLNENQTNYISPITQENISVTDVFYLENQSKIELLNKKENIDKIIKEKEEKDEQHLKYISKLAAKNNIVTKNMIWIDSVNILKEYIKITPIHLVDSSILNIDISLSLIIDRLMRAKNHLEESMIPNEEISLNINEGVKFKNIKGIPVVPISESVFPNYLVCLEDGANVKMLTRYIKKFGHSQSSYRKKFDLPDDYPFYPPASAQKRSDTANKYKIWELTKSRKIERNK